MPEVKTKGEELTDADLAAYGIPPKQTEGLEQRNPANSSPPQMGSESDFAKGEPDDDLKRTKVRTPAVPVRGPAGR